MNRRRSQSLHCAQIIDERGKGHALLLREISHVFGGSAKIYLLMYHPVRLKPWHIAPPRSDANYAVSNSGGLQFLCCLTDRENPVPSRGEIQDTYLLLSPRTTVLVTVSATSFWNGFKGIRDANTDSCKLRPMGRIDPDELVRGIRFDAAILYDWPSAHSSK